MFGLFLQTTANLVPTEVGTNVCNRQAISNQEGVHLQTVIKWLCNFDYDILSFCDLGFLDLCELVVIEDDDSYCWFELLFD